MSTNEMEQDELDKPAEFFRELREDYRSFIEETRVHQDELIHADGGKLAEALELVDKYRERVTRPQEATLDATAFLRLSGIVLEQLRSINVSAGSFKPETFVSQLLGKLQTPPQHQHKRQRRELSDSTSTQFETSSNAGDDTDLDGVGECHWLQLGPLASETFRLVPQPEFLNGPLEAQRKGRVLRERTQQNRSQSATQPTQLGTLDMPNEEQSMAECVHLVYKVLQEYAPLNFYKFFINPSDYGQSVENLFYISFLVFDNRVRVYIDKDTKAPMLDLVHFDSDDEEEEPESPETHCIVNLTSKIWKDAIEKYDISQSIIPSRPKPTEIVSQNGWYR